MYLLKKLTHNKMDSFNLLQTKLPLTKQSWSELKIALYYGKLLLKDMPKPLKNAFKDFGKLPIKIN